MHNTYWSQQPGLLDLLERDLGHPLLSLGLAVELVQTHDQRARQEGQDELDHDDIERAGELVSANGFAQQDHPLQ